MEIAYINCPFCGAKTEIWIPSNKEEMDIAPSHERCPRCMKEIEVPFLVPSDTHAATKKD